MVDTQDTSALRGHPIWALQHQQPRWLICSTLTWFTNPGQCVCEQSRQLWAPNTRTANGGWPSWLWPPGPAAAWGDAPSLLLQREQQSIVTRFTYLCPQLLSKGKGWGRHHWGGMHCTRRGHATKELPKGHRQPVFLGRHALAAHAGCTGLSPLSLMLFYYPG